jgi:hypothetical protein
MESKVKSHISNKTYTTNLDTIEEEDKDLKTELYMLPISGHKIMVAPGKSRMDENGIAFCYVYVIQREKVITKLGVYEKKSDSMPLIFDISTFPEGAFCLFEEFEKNPSKLMDFVMSDEKTVFDFLIESFPALEEKKKTLKAAYRSLYELLSKEENKKDKEMKPILKVISEASKEETPTDAFLYTLKDAVNNEKTFVYTVLALQYVFKIEIKLKTDNGFYQEIASRWAMAEATSTLEVDVETYEIVEKPPVDLDASLSKDIVDESEKEEPEDEMKEAEFKEEDDEPVEESVAQAPDTKLDNLTPKPIDLDAVTPTPTIDPEPPLEPEVEPVKKTRKSRTPKSDTGPKESAKESKPKETKPKETKPKKDLTATRVGTSLNDESVKPVTKVKVPSARKIKMKTVEESPK